MPEKALRFVADSKLFPNLPLSLDGIGLEHEQEHVDRPHGFPGYQWIQCLHGKGKLNFSGLDFIIEEGQGFLLPPSLPHIYHAVTPQWRVSFLCFSGNNVDAILKSLELDTPCIYELSSPALILDYERQIYEICRSNDFHSPINASKLLYSLLLELSQDILAVKNGTKGVLNTKIHTAIHYMNQHYMKPVSLSDIASCVSLSREYFCQLFKTATGFTPGSYLLNIRMAAAKTALIQHPELTVKEIAASCGFDSPSYFCAVFRREEGISPGQYRAEPKFS